MARAWFGAWTVVGIAILSAGCQNKMYDENKALRQQNQELQAQLDSRNSAPPPQPQVVQPPPPQQQAVAMQPQSAPIDQNSPPVKTAAAPDLGNLETRVDARAGTTTVTLPGDVFFDPGQITIKETAKKSLDKVAAALKKEYSGKQVRIEGYTDSTPIVHSKWASNQELSEKRAAAVRDYLVSKGVPAKRISIVGLGDAKPRSKTNLAQNRRVEVVVLTA